MPSVTMVNRMTFSCSTLLCLKWCSRIGGVTPMDEVMNTAVPLTRLGPESASPERKKSIGRLPASRCLRTARRPRFQVVIST